MRQTTRRKTPTFTAQTPEQALDGVEESLRRVESGLVARIRARASEMALKPTAVAAVVGLAGIGIGLWCVLARRPEPRDSGPTEGASAEHVCARDSATCRDGLKRTLTDLLAPAIAHALKALHDAGRRASTGREQAMPRPSE